MIYLDDAATSKPIKEVINGVIDLLQGDYWYNPNSQYDDALKCNRVIEESRNIIAKKINCLPEEIIFVPSASCANSLAVVGYMNANNCNNWVTTTLEHSSISEIKINLYNRFKHIEICDNEGLLHPEQFEKYQDCLISVCGANSEIGTIQPIREIAEVIHKKNNIIHSDLTAYWPHINVDIKDIGVDMATFGSHKIGGLKNCGVLYVKNGIELSPIVFGHGVFSGTPDIYQIFAMGKAADLLNYNEEKEIENKRNHLLDKLLNLDNVYINGSKNKRLSNNINIRIENIILDNQQLVSVMDLLGYSISAGTACASGNKKPSATLLSLGLTPEQVNQSIRITLSNNNTYEELDKFYNDLKLVIEQYKK